MPERVLKNRLTEILGTACPILLGPMRMITLGEMAAAVSRCGGFGQVAASGLSADRLRAELRRGRELTERPLGVNIPVYRPNAFEALEIAVEMGVKTVTTSAGDPAKLAPRIREAGLRFLHKAPSVRLALKAQDAGAAGVIAMGYEAGGHVGREGVATLCLVPQLVDALDIPVVAAGGIADARGFAAALALGAEGVEMGTRFMAAAEAPVSMEIKESIVAAGCEATHVVGDGSKPIRMLKSEFDEEAGAAGRRRGPSVPCGQIAGLVREIETVERIMEEMTAGAREIAARLGSFFEGGPP